MNPLDITKPSLLLDKKIAINNIRKMAAKAQRLGLNFRPHFKTHQSAAVGEWYKEAGVRAITVSSVTMAEYFATNGWKDITIAVSLNFAEIPQIDQLASANQINLVVENPEAVEALKIGMTNPVGIFIKIDTGYHRTGVWYDDFERIERLVSAFGKSSLLQFRGFLTHTGHTYHAHSVDEIRQLHTDSLGKMLELKKRYQPRFPGIILSMGDTPSCSVSENFECVDEIRPGNFVFYDLMQHNLGVCRMEDIAVRLLCPVLSVHPERNEVAIYGGAVHLSKDFIVNKNGQATYGRVIADPFGKKILLNEENFVCRLSQEHGILSVETKNMSLFKPGGWVGIVPVHSCLTANLMRGYLINEGESIGMMGA